MDRRAAELEIVTASQALAAAFLDLDTVLVEDELRLVAELLFVLPDGHAIDAILGPGAREDVAIGLSHLTLAVLQTELMLTLEHVSVVVSLATDTVHESLRPGAFVNSAIIKSSLAPTMRVPIRSSFSFIIDNLTLHSESAGDVNLGAARSSSKVRCAVQLVHNLQLLRRHMVVGHIDVDTHLLIGLHVDDRSRDSGNGRRHHLLLREHQWVRNRRIHLIRCHHTGLLLHWHARLLRHHWLALHRHCCLTGHGLRHTRCNLSHLHLTAWCHHLRSLRSRRLHHGHLRLVRIHN